MGQEPTPLSGTTNDPDAEFRRDEAARQAAAIGADDPATLRSDIATTNQDDPEAIRRDIARTRGEMEGTLGAINDRVNPQRVYQRRRGRARQRWQSLKRNVMGSDDTAYDYDYRYEGGPGYAYSYESDYDRGPGYYSATGYGQDTGSDRGADISGRAQDAKQAVAGRAQDARQAVSDAPQKVEQRARGNPLAAGVIAFGIGALIGSTLPESKAERQAAREATNRLDLEGTKQRLTDRARDMQEGVQDQARDAADDLKGSAHDAAQDVKDHTQQEGQRVKEDTKESGQQLRNQS